MPEKPLSVKRKEFISNLEALINASGLPLFLVETVLRDVHNQVLDESERIYELELKNYKQSLHDAEVK